MKKLIKELIGILIYLIMFGFTNLYSQELDPIFFPSLITVRYQGGYILINFEPLKDSNYNYKIYRSTSAILKDTDLTNANLIKTIKSKDLPFKDKPENEGRYYYAVIASKNNKDFKKLIPLQNTLIYPVVFSPLPKPVKITKISRQKDNIIYIYINPVNKNWKYFLYIDSKKITNLKGKKPKQTITGPKNFFRLEIEKNIYYFFAVTVQNNLNIKNNTLLPNQNVTINPYKIRETKQKTSTSKPKQIIKKNDKKISITPQKKEIYKVKKKSINKQKPSTKTMISRTVSLYFNRNKYKRTIQELNWILKTYKSNNKEKSKIYFYLGQSYYYIKNYKKALKYFIMSKEYPYYIKESNVWIDRVLQKVN